MKNAVKNASPILENVRAIYRTTFRNALTVSGGRGGEGGGR